MNNLILRTITSFFLLFLIFVSLINIQLLFILLLVLNFIVIDEFKKLFNAIFSKNHFFYFISLLSMLVYIVFFTLILLNYLSQSFSVNKFTVFFLLSIIIATDVGGYIFGKVFGGKKLTKVSPNKTYSGALGSLILSIIAAFLFFTFQKKFLFIDLNFIFVVLAISLTSQFGDILISFLKRRAKIKDTGSLLPGHGGMLDRIDGLLFALPLGILIFST